MDESPQPVNEDRISTGEARTAPTLPELSSLESRVLAVLVEKEQTVPDTYPLSLNALTAGCNQKTSRNPLMNASEGEVQAAIDTLRRLALIIESSGGRVMRYAQNVRRVLELPSQSVALLATLMLRGPQTSAELRANCERLYRFSDVSAVEGFLDELAARPAGALVQLMSRQPGAREARWVHLLGGPVADGSAEGLGQNLAGDRRAEFAGPAPGGPPSGSAALELRVAGLEAEVERMRAMLARLGAELGVDIEAD